MIEPPEKPATAVSGASKTASSPQHLQDRLAAEVATLRTAPARNVGAPSAMGGDVLAMALQDIASHYAIATTTVAMTAGLPLVEDRLPLAHVGLAAARCGLEVDAAQVDLATLGDAWLPALMVDRDGGIELLWRIERDRTGRPVGVETSLPGCPEHRTRRRFDGATQPVGRTVLRVRPKPIAQSSGEDCGDSSRTTPDNWFLSAFSGSRRVYGEAIAATVAINVLALAMPLYSMNVYDRVLPNVAQETLWALSIGVLLATLFDFAIKSLRGHFVDRASARADVLLANLIYARLLGARLSERPVSAGVRANTLREFETLREFFNSATLTAFGDMPFVVLFLVMIAVVGGWLVAVPLIGIPVLLGVGWWTQKRLTRLSEASFRETALKNAVVVETLIGLETIKATGAESWAAAKWERAVAEHIRSSLAIRHLTNVGLHAIHGAQTLIQVAMIILGFYMVAGGALTAGGLIASTMLIGRALQPLGQLAMLIARLHQTRIAYRQLTDLVMAPQERPDGPSSFVTPTFSGAVTFENVVFGYDKDAAPVLSGISFEIKPGERVGILGTIGTGKSTALKLIHALHQPASGRVLIDGVPVTMIDPVLLRRNVGLALSAAELFEGTIRGNIALADPGASQHTLTQAASAAGALDWILRLPKGFDTPLRERGMGLSGGQRQSLSLARTLLAEPRILLLDEPTSDMDQRTERDVLDRLGRTLKGRTLILVTHRPALLDLVDRLIVLDQGRKLLDGPKAVVLHAMRTMNDKRAPAPAAAKSVETAS